MLSNPQKDNNTKFTLITGLHNSGKTSYLRNSYRENSENFTSGQLENDAYFIDIEMAVSEWVNESQFAKVLEHKQIEVKANGYKLTNRVKMECLADYVQDKHLYLDNAHRATATKVPLVKQLLLSCKKATITTLDEGLIAISLRDVILGEEPKHIRLKATGKYLPTFDITPIIFGGLIMTAFTTGHYTAGYILAGLATMTFRMRSAKQT